jgi:uncharacterized protein (DUF3820 family)
MMYEKLKDDDIMPWGKYAGHKMANIPPDYLLWLLENNKCGGSVKAYIEENKNFLELERKQNKKNERR